MTHSHTCRKCKIVWAHDRPIERDRTYQHICPGCGELVTIKSEDAPTVSLLPAKRYPWVRRAAQSLRREYLKSKVVSRWLRQALNGPTTR